MQPFLDQLPNGDAGIRCPGEEAMRRPTQEVVTQHSQLRYSFIGRERAGAQMIQEQDIAHHFVKGLDRLARIVKRDQGHGPIRARGEIGDQHIVTQPVPVAGAFADHQPNVKRAMVDLGTLGLCGAQMGVDLLPVLRAQGLGQLAGGARIPAFDDKQVTAFHHRRDRVARPEPAVSA
jgi:hypothetical protein